MSELRQTGFLSKHAGDHSGVVTLEITAFNASAAIHTDFNPDFSYHAISITYRHPTFQNRVYIDGVCLAIDQSVIVPAGVKRDSLALTGSWRWISHDIGVCTVACHDHPLNNDDTSAMNMYGFINSGVLIFDLQSKSKRCEIPSDDEKWDNPAAHLNGNTLSIYEHKYDDTPNQLLRSIELVISKV